jgi:hypothetical protein
MYEDGWVEDKVDKNILGLMCGGLYSGILFVTMK